VDFSDGALPPSKRDREEDLSEACWKFSERMPNAIARNRAPAGADLCLFLQRPYQTESRMLGLLFLAANGKLIGSVAVEVRMTSLCEFNDNVNRQISFQCFRSFNLFAPF
jgi:hypothetical protein